MYTLCTRGKIRIAFFIDILCALKFGDRGIKKYKIIKLRIQSYKINLSRYLIRLYLIL